MEIQQQKQFGIAAVRVSSTKQGLIGDSPEDQKAQIERFAAEKNIAVIKFFKFIESATGEIQPSQEAIDYCKEHRGTIQWFLVKSIDRFTRGGSMVYAQLKSQLVKYGVNLIDVAGIINPTTVNKLAHLGKKYNWSVDQPSHTSEMLEAERVRQEARSILVRLIGSEIRYTQLGYTARGAPPGYLSERIDTPHGSRYVYRPHHIEAEWFIAMFVLRAQNTLSDEEIVDKVNLLGFKTRKRKLRDKKNKVKVIGYIGGNPLTVKLLQRYIQNTIYAGVNTEKWTNDPVKCKFEGLVSIDLFNRANKGKKTVVEEDGLVKVYKGKIPEYLQKRNKNNPDYPYKQYIVCNTCHKPLLGSAPRSKSGEHIARYHCSRKHKYWSINKNKLHDAIEKFVKNIQFTSSFRKSFNAIVLEEWHKREKYVSNEVVSLAQRITAADQELQMLKDKIKSLDSPGVINMFEQDIEKLLREKARLIDQRNKKEYEGIDIQTALNYADYFMEHLHDLLLGGSDPLKNASFFGLLFEVPPTYDQLVNGTPILSPLLSLNKISNDDLERPVTPTGVEPVLLG